MLRSIIQVSLMFILVGSGFAQMAPRETVTAEIGRAKISVEYGRPSLKGRSFDELVSKLPENRMWRAGSEQITTLTTTGPLQIGGQMVPPGKYSLYVYCPENGAYALAVNKVLGQPLKNLWREAPANLAEEPWPHMNYEEIKGSEVARIPLKKVTLSDAVDLFTITIDEESGSENLVLAWGDQRWSVDIKAARSEGSHREGS